MMPTMVPIDESAANMLSPDDAALAANYMSQGRVVLAARMLQPDRIDPTGARIPLCYSTDGNWVWSAEAQQYVERYRMALPAEFLEHIQTQGGNCPPVTDDQAAAMATYFRAAPDRPAH